MSATSVTSAGTSLYGFLAIMMEWLMRVRGIGGAGEGAADRVEIVMPRLRWRPDGRGCGRGAVQEVMTFGTGPGWTVWMRRGCRGGRVPSTGPAGPAAVGPVRSGSAGWMGFGVWRWQRWCCSTPAYP